MQIDTLVMVIADPNGGKSNQMRTIFEEAELHHQYGGYPRQNFIAKHYLVDPDIELFIKLSSPHEKKEDYAAVKRQIIQQRKKPSRRYKVFLAAQVSATRKLVKGEELFIQLIRDFDIRRACAVWLNPDRSARTPFRLSRRMAQFMTRRREVSALALDSLALHPSASPGLHSVNSRILCDLLFRS